MQNNILYLEDKYQKAFLLLFILSIIYIIPIMIADFEYVDDLGRSLGGYAKWDFDGRPLVTIISFIFSNGKILMDTSPWLQIVSVFLLDYMLILWLKKYTASASWFAISCIGFCAYSNLFMLENLSFHYDSLGMISSIFISIFLYALPESICNRKTLLYTCYAVFFLLCCYQAAIGGFISLMVIESVYLLYQNETLKNIFKRFGVRLSGLLIGGTLYKLLIANTSIPKDGYSGEHTGMINIFMSGNIYQIFNNINGFFDIFYDYGISIGVIGLLFFLVGYLGIGHLSYDIWKKRTEPKVTRLIISLFVFSVPIILLIASFFVMSLLQKPIYVPRVMISFTIVSLFMGIGIYHLSRVKKWMLSVMVLMMIFVLSFSSYYGNLLARQKQMDSIIITSLVHDINRIEYSQNKEISNIAFLGHSPRSKNLILATTYRPLFDRLVPIYMDNDYFWGQVYLYHYRQKPVTCNIDGTEREYISASEPVQRNEYYRLYLDGDKLIIAFTEDSSVPHHQRI